MTTYSDDDFARIAGAVDVDVARVASRASGFEAAAMWYGLATRRPHRVPPSKMRERLDRVARNARRMLRSLGIADPAGAEVGPGDLDLFEALGALEDAGEEGVRSATTRVGRLATLLEAIDAAGAFGRWASRAAGEAGERSPFSVPPGHRGDTALNDWIADMMVLYREITGREPRTSVGAINQPNEGVATGPLVRFLAAAGAPLDLTKDEDALRARVRSRLLDPE